MFGWLFLGALLLIAIVLIGLIIKDQVKGYQESHKEENTKPRKQKRGEIKKRALGVMLMVAIGTLVLYLLRKDRKGE